MLDPWAHLCCRSVLAVLSRLMFVLLLEAFDHPQRQQLAPLVQAFSGPHAVVLQLLLPLVELLVLFALA